MIGPWAAPPADGASYLFCERCGSPARSAGSLERRGPRTCRACGIFACARCWSRSAGSCPACGVAIDGPRVLPSLRRADRAATAAGAASAATADTAAAEGDPRATLVRPARRIAAPAIAATALAVGVLVLGSLIGRAVPPSGDVAALVGTPEPSGGPAIEPSRSLSASEPVIDGATPAPGADNPDTVGAGVAGEPGSAGSTSAATPAATPPPTIRPRPSDPPPTAAPTPSRTPAPTPCRLVVPQLVGARRNDAGRLWSDAGFSGPVTALDGRGNYAIGSQTPAAGGDAPCDAGVTIGPAAG